MGTEAGGQGDDAIRALGPLFRLTEVFLWDDASRGIFKSSTCDDNSSAEDSADCVSSLVSCSFSITDDATSAEDLELARQMNALGLPTSFKTNKEQRTNTSTGGKRRGMLKKSTSVHKDTGVQVPEMSRQAEVIDSLSSQVSDGSRTRSHTCAAIQAENDASHVDTDGAFNNAVQTDGEPNSQAFIIPEKIVKEQLCTEAMDVVVTDGTNCYPSMNNAKKNTEAGIDLVDFRFTNPQENAVENVGLLCFLDEKLCLGQGGDINLEDTSNLCCVIKSEGISTVSDTAKCFSDMSGFGDGGEWGVFWDAFYMRNYYYNFRTQKSTWHPPSGLEQSGFSFTSNKINTDVPEEGSYLAFPGDDNNDQGAVEVTTLSHDVQNSRKMPSDVTEEGTYLAVASDDYNCQGAVKVTSPSVEVQNDEVSSQASHEVMSRIDAASENLTFDMDLSILGGSSNYSDEHVGHINCSKSSSAKDFCEVPFCPSDTTDPADRLANASQDTGAEENWLGVSQQGEIVSMSTDLCSHHHVMNHNKKRKVKRIKSNQKTFSGEDKGHGLPGIVEGLPAYLMKYWYQRYSLFSKFDHGVKVDDEGWFSVTPEAIARHHASRCGRGTVVDCFSGIGGNAIQFAMMSDHVIAIDIDPQKVDFARHNATIYGLQSNIDFIKGDFFILASQLKADTVFMSPPWGGPDYAKVQIFDIRSMLKPHDGHFLFMTAMKIASSVVMFLPRNVDPNQLAELSLLAYPPWGLEVERNYLNGKLKGITAYFYQQSNASQEISNDLYL